MLTLYCKVAVIINSKEKLPAFPFNLLCICANPIDDSILIKIMLVSKCKSLSFPQLPHKDKGRTLKVVPLLGHLGDKQRRKISVKLNYM